MRELEYVDKWDLLKQISRFLDRRYDVLKIVMELMKNEDVRVYKTTKVEGIIIISDGQK